MKLCYGVYISNVPFYVNKFEFDDIRWVSFFFTNISDTDTFVFELILMKYVPLIGLNT